MMKASWLLLVWFQWVPHFHWTEAVLEETRCYDLKTLEVCGEDSLSDCWTRGHALNGVPCDCRTKDYHCTPQDTECFWHFRASDEKGYQKAWSGDPCKVFPVDTRCLRLPGLLCDEVDNGDNNCYTGATDDHCQCRSTLGTNNPCGSDIGDCLWHYQSAPKTYHPTVPPQSCRKALDPNTFQTQCFDEAARALGSPFLCDLSTSKCAVGMSGDSTSSGPTTDSDTTDSDTTDTVPSVSPGSCVCRSDKDPTKPCSPFNDCAWYYCEATASNCQLLKKSNPPQRCRFQFSAADEDLCFRHKVGIRELCPLLTIDDDGDETACVMGGVHTCECWSQSTNALCKADDNDCLWQANSIFTPQWCIFMKPVAKGKGNGKGQSQAKDQSQTKGTKGSSKSGPKSGFLAAPASASTAPSSAATSTSSAASTLASPQLGSKGQCYRRPPHDDQGCGLGALSNCGEAYSGEDCFCLDKASGRLCTFESEACAWHYSDANTITQPEQPCKAELSYHEKRRNRCFQADRETLCKAEDANCRDPLGHECACLAPSMDTCPAGSACFWHITPKELFTGQPCNAAVASTLSLIALLFVAL